MTHLQPYSGEQEAAVSLIQAFWRCHSFVEQTREDALQDLQAWTAGKHSFFFILHDEERVGFLHLGSRGGPADWLETLFVLPTWQNRGIGSAAVHLAEEIVQSYSDFLHIEAVARNEGAIRLYHRLGYDCLNSIIIRKDFRDTGFKYVLTETLYGLPFEIRKKD